MMHERPPKIPAKGAETDTPSPDVLKRIHELRAKGTEGAIKEVLKKSAKKPPTPTSYDPIRNATRNDFEKIKDEMLGKFDTIVGESISHFSDPIDVPQEASKKISHTMADIAEPVEGSLDFSHLGTAGERDSLLDATPGEARKSLAQVLNEFRGMRLPNLRDEIMPTPEPPAPPALSMREQMHSSPEAVREATAGLGSLADFREQSRKKGERARREVGERTEPAMKAVQVGAEQLTTEREAMLAAERAYLDARKAKKFDKLELAKLEAAYDGASATYNAALEERVSAEMGTRKWLKEKSPEEQQKFIERYRRLVISKDVIDRGEKELDKALAGKERGGVGKAWQAFVGWSEKQNAGLEKKLGKQGARAARIVGSAVLGAGVASAAGAGLAAFGLGALGYRVARGVVGTAVGATLGGVAGVAYENTLGARQAKKLQSAREKGAGGFEDIRALRTQYRKGSKEAIAKKQRRIEAGTAFVAGAGITASLYQFPSVRDAVDDLAKIEAITPEQVDATPVVSSDPPPAPDVAQEEATPATSDAVPMTEQSEREAVSSAPEEIKIAAESATKPPVSVSIDKRGEGATKLFSHLQESLRAQGYTPETVPADSDLKYILTHTPDQSSAKFGFLKAEGSRVMKLGDTFTINPDGALETQVASEKYMLPRTRVETPVAPKVVEVPKLADEGEIKPHLSPTVETAAANDIIYGSPENFPHIPPEAHAEAIDLVRTHGTAPGEGESYTDFRARVAAAATSGEVARGRGGLEVPLGQTHIYQTSGDRLVVYGGDPVAQRAVMHEYLRSNPDTMVHMNEKTSNGVERPIIYRLRDGSLAPEGVAVRRPGWLVRNLFPFLENSNALSEAAKPGDFKKMTF